MYDKLKLWAARTRDTPDITKFLDRAKEQIDHDTGEITTFGSLEGLKISIFTGGISIIGSLSKYLYPNNIYPLDRHSTAEAVEKLSDNLHLNISDAKVTGLEFGTQFVMRHKPEDYLRRLGDMPRLQRYHFDVGTLYYKPRGRQKRLYPPLCWPSNTPFSQTMQCPATASKQRKRARPSAGASVRVRR